MIQTLLLIAGAIGAVGGLAGAAAIVRVFAVDRQVVKREETTVWWDENRKLRADLDHEVSARRKDREDSDREIALLRQELSKVRNNWDACRAECQRLRLLVEGTP
jgi:hypothetical protein